MAAFIGPNEVQVLTIVLPEAEVISGIDISPPGKIVDSEGDSMA